MAVSSSKWRPKTSAYDYNYGVGINFYQPMVDFIEDKSRGRKVIMPHLPWTDELGLEQFDPLKIKSYSQEDLSRISRQTEASAKTKLRDFKSSASSSFVLQKSVSAATITQKVKTDTRKKKTMLRDIRRIKDRMYEDLEMFNPDKDRDLERELKASQKFLRGRSAKQIEQQLLSQSNKAIAEALDEDIQKSSHVSSSGKFVKKLTMRSHVKFMDERIQSQLEESFKEPLENLSVELKDFDRRSAHFYQDKSKATSIEIEQLNARVVEAETRLKTEVTRIKKKLQIQITELEMSLDSANKLNIDLQKTIKKQSLQLTELQAHYDEIQRQLQVTLDQLSVSQRRVQALTAESEEIRSNYESALRGKRQAEQLAEEAGTRVNELTTINVNLASAKSKIEQELSVVISDYEEINKELRISDERYQRVQAELKHTVEILHEEQERVVKIEAIKKSLEIEVKNLSVRLEEVEANAIVGGKRIISKLEARIRDIEAELDEEKRRHAETIKILRKKERTVKEVMIQCEEDQKNIALLQESLDKANSKITIFKRQLQEVEGVSSQSITRVRRFQRELEAAEDRAETAESSLNLIRAKHRTFVTTSTVPGSQVYLVQEQRATSEI
ncbi:paramyosin, short form isoform X2 [Diorhabda carinulata]|uniref:paramyosin, short form isoform X2 n=1 Tax=Diorhabda sublineata TaxID=1163346 RepID=UPI0024E158E1|nr:paramyosin, short form isoform X2 [Diorhabda sublineata]XP_057671752.1 paramyosin, short form isoform X2 [Diorhabda carinulata]